MIRSSLTWACWLSIGVAVMGMTGHVKAQAPEETVRFSPAPAPGSIPPQGPVYASPPEALTSEIPAAPPPPAAAAATPANGVAGWYPDEGFAIKSEDGNYKLRVGLQAGYRFEPYWLDGTAQPRRNFFVLRPIIEGHIFREWIRFWTSFEFSQNPPYLLDSYVELQPWKQFGLRIGQQYTPLSRHEYVGPHQLLFPDWASVADFFWTGRDKGITALGSVLGGKLDYYVGGFGGSPLRQFVTFPGTWVAMARLTVNPMGPVASNEVPYIASSTSVPRRVSFTVQGASGDYALAAANLNPSAFRFDIEDTGVRSKQTTGSLDLWLQGPRFSFLAEAYMRRKDQSDFKPFRASGLWGQAGVMVWDRTMDVGARFNWLNASDHLKNDKGYSLEGQVGYYPLHTLNLQAHVRYGYGRQQNPGTEDLGAVTLLLPPGKNHLLTLQIMIAI